MKNFIRFSLFVGGLLATPALAEEAVVAPGKSEEKCFFMTAGQAGQYDFSASAPLEFNLHFHTRYVHYLVDPVMLSEADDKFVVSYDQTYCLMWTNKTADEIALRYSYSLEEQKPDTNNPAQADQATTPGLVE